MRRLAFRRVLPIVQLALFLLLVPMGEKQRADHYQQLMTQAEREGGWVLMWHDSYEPPALVVAQGLNAPVFLVLAVAGAFDVHAYGEGWGQFYLLGSFGVVLLWYFVGRAIDRRFDVAGVGSEHSPSFIRRILVGLSCLSLAVLALFFLSMYTDGYSSTFSLDLWLVLWFGFGAIAQWRKLARWRAARNPTTLHLQPNR